MDLTYEEALQGILDQVPPPTPESLRLEFALGRFLTETLVSPVDLPPFDNSSMDGYAVRAADVAAARGDSPVRLRLLAEVAAGEWPNDSLEPGSAIRLFTGAPLPPGAGAVVMQESTRQEPSCPGTVDILESVSHGENVRKRGEDIAAGTALARVGEPLRSGIISLLGATGRASVLVGQRPRVALLATGSELREPTGTPTAPSTHELRPGQIFESNRVGLATLVQSAGGIPELLPLVSDDLAATRSALERAFVSADIVVASGGVSVGEHDLVRRAIKDVGAHLQFWRVAIKPGRPFAFATVGSKLFFGLPGNPVSALVTFVLLARPALLRWQGAASVKPESHPGILAEPLENRGDRRHFLRVKVEPDGRVSSAGKQASHILTSLAVANGLLDLPPDSSLPAGAKVQVLRW